MLESQANQISNKNDLAALLRDRQTGYPEENRREHHGPCQEGPTISLLASVEKRTSRALKYSELYTLEALVVNWQRRVHVPKR